MSRILVSAEGEGLTTMVDQCLPCRGGNVVGSLVLLLGLMGSGSWYHMVRLCNFGLISTR